MNKQLRWSLLLKIVGIISVLIVVYTLLMYLSYLIPQEWIADNIQLSLDTIHSEDKRWSVMTHLSSTKLDTFTDDLIFKKMTNNDLLSALKAAMWNNGYVRYWLGDIAILRPLLIIFHYTNIRYFNLFIIFPLLFLVLNQLYTVLGNVWAYFYLMINLLMHVWIFPLSLQYSPVFILTQLAVMLILWLYQRQSLSLEKMLYIMVVIGSLTNFFDLLTVPLLTFGMPWVIYFVLMNRFATQSIQKNYIETIVLGSGWLMSFGLTWFSKWLIASIILNENVFMNVSKQAVLRTAGTVDESLNIQSILSQMWQHLLPNEGKVILFLWVIMLLVGFWSGHRKLFDWLSTSPLMLMSVIPFVWVLLLKNHNQHHHYFTYRLFALTLFCAFSYVMINIPKFQRKKEI